MDITKFAKATIDYFKYLSEYPTDYTRQKKFVELVQNNNSVIELLLQRIWQPNKTVVAGQAIWSPNMPVNTWAVVETAGTTNATEPTWNEDTVTDGNVTYTMREFIGDGVTSLIGAFPIGYIMLTMDGNNPSAIFGGEWRLIKTGVVLINAGAGYTAGTEYGADTVTLATTDIPSHSHSGTISGGSHNHTASSNSTGAHTHTAPFGKTSGTGLRNENMGNRSVNTSSAGAHSHTITVATSSSHSHTFTGGSTGGGGEHNNKQPYRAVYMWERIA